MIAIGSLEEWRKQVPSDGRSFLLLWKSGSEQSECAFRNLDKAAREHPEMTVASADVSHVRDIHPQYNIATVPSLLVFDNGKFRNVVKGCQDKKTLTAVFEEAVYRAAIASSDKPQKNVTVYTTPTCSWCNTLKQWLRKNQVPYHEIDVSRDEQAARDLVSRSGQQGVPQTEINGQIVVGFDQPRLKQLLEI